MVVEIFLDLEAKLPEYQYEGDAGADVCSIDDNFMLAPGESKMVHTGIYMNIPNGIECQVRPRSGLAAKYGITVLNSPGTIDSFYKGECNVILINHSKNNFLVEKGMRIGQFVFNEYKHVDFYQVHNKDMIGTSNRGDGGFNSTGLK